MLSMYRRVTTILTIICLGCPSAGWGQGKKPQNPPTATLAGGEQRAMAVVPTGQVAVLYQNTDLMIVSHKAPLLDVLREVCSQIGAELDAPFSADDMVQGVIGPGAVREVLATLLTGLPYDFATAGSAEDPNRVARIVVVPKTKDSGAKEKNNTAAPDAGNSEARNASAQTASRPQLDLNTDIEDAVKLDIPQMLELLTQAKGEIAQAEGVNSGDLAKVLDEVEANIKATPVGNPEPATPQSTPAPTRPIIRHGHR